MKCVGAGVTEDWQNVFTVMLAFGANRKKKTQTLPTRLTLCWKYNYLFS
jgi:hypothetical protein